MLPIVTDWEKRTIMRLTHSAHHYIVLTVSLAAVWLGLSGHYTGLLLFLGVLCVALCVWIAARMELIDAEVNPAQFHLLPSLLYLGWLAREVVLSAIDVSKRVLDPRLPISPRAITLPLSQRTELGRTVYANSITLTPGTVSIDLPGGELLVHALHADAAAGVEAGDMDRRCRALEAEPS